MKFFNEVFFTAVFRCTTYPSQRVYLTSILIYNIKLYHKVRRGKDNFIKISHYLALMQMRISMSALEFYFHN
jgi:hypothetical protein